jgi:hypothetical protein
VDGAGYMTPQQDLEDYEVLATAAFIGFVSGGTRFMQHAGWDVTTWLDHLVRASEVLMGDPLR